MPRAKAGTSKETQPGFTVPSFTPEEVDGIAALIGATDAGTKRRLRSGLERAANAYRAALYFAGAPTAGEMRAALRPLLGALRRARDLADSLDDATRSHLILEGYPHHVGRVPGENESPRRAMKADARRLERMILATGEALDRLPSRITETPESVLFRSLAEAYRRVTGEPARLKKRSRDPVRYEGRFLGFVRKCVAAGPIKVKLPRGEEALGRRVLRALSADARGQGRYTRRT